MSNKAVSEKKRSRPLELETSNTPDEACDESARNKLIQYQARTSSYNNQTESIQTVGIFDPDVGQERGREESLPLRYQTQHAPPHAGEDEETTITSIRAIDVTLGLRRIPAGFYAIVHHSDREWRTENKRSSVNDDLVQWDRLVPIPADPSTSVCLEVYASFELQPMLGAGERLRKLTITVEQLLDRSEKDLPFTLFPKEGDVVSPCSSIFITVKRRKCGSGDLSTPGIHASYYPGIGSKRELEDVIDQGHSAFLRHQKYGRKRDLEHSIRYFERALSICPPNHTCRAAAQSNLAMAKFTLCQIEDTDASSEVLSLYREALATRPAGHADRPSILIRLAVVHTSLFQRRGDTVAGAQAEALLHEAMELSPAGCHESQAADFILQLHGGRKVVPAQTDGQSRMQRDSTPGLTFQDLRNLSVQLLYRFAQFGDLADVQQSIKLLRELVKLTPDRDPWYLSQLTNLAAALSYRFGRLGELGDLEEAISIITKAVRLTPRDHPDRPSRLNNLGTSFVMRFQRFRELSDLEDAISRHKDAVDLTPDGHLDKPTRLHNLGSSLDSRFDCLGELSDVREAIFTLRHAVNLAPHDHPHKSICLLSLGSSLLARFGRLGEISDLNDAISSLTDAVHLTPPDHPSIPDRLAKLGCALKLRFDRLGKLCDLEAAISTFRSAVAHTHHGHADRFIVLNNLGACLRVRFQRLGGLRDIEDAISTLRAAVDLIPRHHPDRPGCLSNLGYSLYTRSQHLGEPHDLVEAISRQKDAVDLTPDHHPHKPACLCNLSTSFFARFKLLEELSDLEEAISLLKHALDLTADGHPHKPLYLHNLASLCAIRFEHLGGLDDLEDGIAMLIAVVHNTPSDHPRKPACLSNLASCFITRFKHLGELSDLEEAISTLRNALKLTPHGYPAKPARLYTLGDCLITRFEHLKVLSDLEQALSLYSHAAYSPFGDIDIRFRASQKWISCARRTRHQSLLRAYSVAVNLLPRLAWIGLSLTHSYAQLIRGADVVREAAAAALDAGLPELAVEWLEQGRSIVWGELFQLRSSYAELSSAHPQHAQRLRELSAALEHASAAREKSSSAFTEIAGPALSKLVTATKNAGAGNEDHLTTLLQQTDNAIDQGIDSMKQEADKHRALAIERDELLREIRKITCFDHFLRKKFSQLRASAHSGPVVILNAAEARCDALVVLSNIDHVIHVPLPNFPFKRFERLKNILQGLLRQARIIRFDDREGHPATETSDGFDWEFILNPLWECVVKPILHALAFSIPGDLSRIFWCPTGPFSFFPIHAAGLYGSRFSQSGYKVSDFVVSSYVPTLSILTRSTNSNNPPNSDVRLLTVRQPSSDGLSRLPGVRVELEHIKEVVIKSPSACTILPESASSTVEDVLSLMKEADWVHFACHGIQDAANPIDSGLCLADGRRLRLRDIMALSRPHGGLAFLSACQTATGDAHLSDESVHIAAGMLFAGYGGVVGTMWSISDSLAPVVARDVYARLFEKGTKPDHREAARALHDAVGRVRDGGCASFAEWLPFIHVGL